MSKGGTTTRKAERTFLRIILRAMPDQCVSAAPQRTFPLPPTSPSSPPLATLDGEPSCKPCRTSTRLSGPLPHPASPDKPFCAVADKLRLKVVLSDGEKSRSGPAGSGRSTRGGR